MADQSVPRFVEGLDDDIVQVGRPVVSLKARLLADMIHHVASYRRPGAMHAVYQVDQSTTRGVSTNEQFEWQWLPGANSDNVCIRALSLGGLATGSGDQAALTADTSTDVSVKFAESSDGETPTSTISSNHMVESRVFREITPNGTVETVVIDQQTVGNGLRVLGLAIDEAPTSIVSYPGDTVSVDRSKFASGRDIIDTAYDDLPLALHTMRLECKKIVHATCKIVTTTAVQPAGVGEDIYTGSSMNYMRWTLYLSPVRPENTTTPVTCYVRAAHSASDGRVRFAFGTGTPGDITINSATPAWYSTTANIAKDTDTLSIQCWGNVAGTFTLYGAVVCETHETA